jgi:hypothetical protein
VKQVAVDFEGRIFLGRGGLWFLQGFLRKVVCKTWCFGGEFVVNCVVEVVVWMHGFRRRKKRQVVEVFFVRQKKWI